MPFGVHQRQPKKKKPSAKTLKRYERAAAAAEKKVVAAEAVSAEAKEGALGADAIDAASQEAFWARERAAEASAKLAAASAPSERHAAYCRLGKEAQINGTVKRVKPSWRDEEAHREAEQRLTVEQVRDRGRDRGRGAAPDGRHGHHLLARSLTPVFGTSLAREL